MLARNKIALIVVGTGIAVVSAYVIGTSDAVVSRILRKGLTSYVHAPCRFDAAHFTFLEGIEVTGLVVLDPADPFGAPLLAAERCRVDYRLDVTGFGPHVTGIDLERPQLRLERSADGTLPIERVFTLPASRGPAVPRPPVRLTGGTVTFADPSIVAGEPLELRDLTVTLTPPGTKTTSWAGTVADVTATSDVLGALSLRAVVDAEGRSVAVSLDLPKIRIDPALPRRFVGELARRLAGLAPSGELSAHIDARAEEGKDWDARAAVTLRDISLTGAIPETSPGRPDTTPIAVEHLGGHVTFGAGRLELSQLTFQALGAEFRVDGTVDDLTGAAPALGAKATIRALRLTRELRSSMPWLARRIAEAYDLTATLDATVTASGPLASPTVLGDADVTAGHVRYEGYVQEDGLRHGFPWDADGAAGKVRFDGRDVHIDATARHGAARVSVTGVIAHPPGGGSIPDLTIVAEDAPLDGDIRHAFGDRAPQVFDRWMPSGIASRITVRIFEDVPIDGEHVVTDVTLDCDGRAEFRPQLLPVPLRGATGRVEVINPVVGGRREELVRLTNVAAKADGFDVTVSGEVRGEGDAQREELDVDVVTADAAGGFRDAAFLAPDSTLSPGVKGAIRKLGASGPVRIAAHLVKTADQTRHDVVTIRLEGTSVRGWDDIPLAARGLTGTVTLANDTLTFERIAGFSVMEGFEPAIAASGRLLDLSGTPQFDVHVESPEIPLGEPLRMVLGPLAVRAHEFWDRVRPQGSARAGLVLDIRPDAHATPFEVTLTHIRGSLSPGGLELDNDDGRFHFDGRSAELTGLESAIGAAVLHIDEAHLDVATNRVEVRASVRGLRFPEDLEGPLSEDTIAAIVERAPGRTLHASDVHVVYEPGPSAVEIAGNLSIRPRTRRALPDPGYAPDGSLAVDRLVFWLPENAPIFMQGEARVDAFSLRAGLPIDKMNGALEVSGSLGAEPHLAIRVKQASLRVAEYPLSAVDARVEIEPRGARVNLTGKFMAGDLAASVGPAGGGAGFQGSLHVADADLERLLRLRGDPRKEVATGKIVGGVDFINPTGARPDLRGAGKVTVRDGRLMQTPGVGEVVRFVTLGAYTPVLTDGDLKFELEGDRVLVKELSVTGSGVNASIDRGDGSIGFDGRIDMAVYPRFDFGLPIIDQIWHIIQSPLPRRVRVTGTLRNPRTNWELMSTGGADYVREPQPAGDVGEPSVDPW